VSEDEGRQLAQNWGCSYIECSAKHNENVAELFIKLLHEVEKDLSPPGPPPSEGGCILM
jgi:Ras homolog enriched in brain